MAYQRVILPRSIIKTEITRADRERGTIANYGIDLYKFVQMVIDDHTSLPVTANNGLTATVTPTLTTIRLGGLLTQDTTIDGDGETFGMGFQALSYFAVECTDDLKLETTGVASTIDIISPGTVSIDAVDIELIGEGTVVRGTSGIFMQTPDQIALTATAGQVLTLVDSANGECEWQDTALSYNVYSALLTQTGTNAPVATVLENTLGGTVVWSYVSAGTYRATLASAFTANKTAVQITMSTTLNPNYTVVRATDASVATQPNSIGIIVVDSSGTNSNNAMVQTFIEIRVYP
jgi:hypothetical protein